MSSKSRRSKRPAQSRKKRKKQRSLTESINPAAIRPAEKPAVQAEVTIPSAAPAPAPAAARPRYPYIATELRRISILAGVVVIILVGLALGLQ